MHRSTPITVKPRTGATLVEILMALMIFGIGIVSVFTLFPVSLLSSIQATKLTNSKILADNVVDQIRTNPEVLRPPGTTASDVWEGIWKPNSDYSVGDLVWPSIEPGNLFPTPNIAFRCNNAGTSGASEPQWNTSADTTDNGATWEPVLSNPNYIVDPLGRFVEGADMALRRPTFGADGTNLLAGGLPRTDGNFPPNENINDLTFRRNEVLARARTVFTQPDSWTVVVDAVPITVDNGTTAPDDGFVTFPTKIDLNQVTPANHRVVIVSEDGDRSAVRGIVSRSGQQINLSGIDIPGDYFSPGGGVGRVRIEAFTPRYSFLVTVQRPTDPSSGDPSVDPLAVTQSGLYKQPKATVAIMFNRSFSLEDEEVFDANFGNPSYNEVAEVTHGGLATDQIRISWMGKKKPLLREGNYVLDGRFAIWYRMIDISEDEMNSQADITLDRTVEVQTDDVTTVSDVGRAIFLPGIVEIFEL